MSGKWSSRTKEALNTVEINDGLENLTGGDRSPIVAFYRYSIPRTPNALARVLEAGTKIEGTYEGSFIMKSKNPKFQDQTLFKVGTDEGTVALASSFALSKGLAAAKVGGRVVIVYTGKSDKGYHNFTVRGERA